MLADENRKIAGFLALFVRTTLVAAVIVDGTYFNRELEAVAGRINTAESQARRQA